MPTYFLFILGPLLLACLGRLFFDLLLSLLKLKLHLRKRNRAHKSIGDTDKSKMESTTRMFVARLMHVERNQ